MPASLLCCPQYVMAAVVYRWVLELGCPGGTSAPPAAARRGKPAGPPRVDIASLRAGSLGDPELAGAGVSQGSW